MAERLVARRRTDYASIERTPVRFPESTQAPRRRRALLLFHSGILVFRINIPPSQALTLVGSGLTGLGLGVTVAPALFVAGFSLASQNLQRVFAIVELLRAVAAFLVAPILVYLAATIGTGVAGTEDVVVRQHHLGPARAQPRLWGTLS